MISGLFAEVDEEHDFPCRHPNHKFEAPDLNQQQRVYLGRTAVDEEGKLVAPEKRNQLSMDQYRAMAGRTWSTLSQIRRSSQDHRQEAANISKLMMNITKTIPTNKIDESSVNPSEVSNPHLNQTIQTAATQTRTSTRNQPKRARDVITSLSMTKPFEDTQQSIQRVMGITKGASTA